MVISTYERLKEQDLPVNREIMNAYLNAATRNKETELVVDALNSMHEKKIEPYSYLLKMLGEMEEHPDSLYLALKNFDVTYGSISRKIRKFKEPSERKKSYKAMNLPNKRSNRRI